uniref:Uncharacterized protein n=1 Tax=Picea glauca TaxID=3330 RepID=A0A101LYJ5_PICGL|nr:hypothetical protein ABT39_MTgene5749 [Picea glauca]QHR87674.1 hypothetical protein Q903MT_gene1686 [Picea sitchensis]
MPEISRNMEPEMWIDARNKDMFSVAFLLMLLPSFAAIDDYCYCC